LRNYKLFSLFGIGLELHWSFLLLVFLLLVLDPSFMLLFLIIFVFVTLHEFSHSVVASTQGISVKKIVLLPIGGMAVMDVTDIEPIKELLMAAAGPAFNFVMMLGLYLVSSSLGLPLMEWFDLFIAGELLDLGRVESVIFYSFWANFILGVFNFFVPAFPMDGGRIFRSLLAMRFGQLKATLIARNVSIFISLLMLVLGFFGGNLWLVVIGVFLILGSSSEYQSLSVIKALEGVNAEAIISIPRVVVGEEEPIARVLQKMVHYNSTYAVVVGGKRPRVFGLAEAAAVPRVLWQTRSVGSASSYVPPAGAGSDLSGIFKRMRSSGLPAVPVLKGGVLVGVVDKFDIDRLLSLRGAFS